MTRFPGLAPEVNPKNRWEFIDHDYIAKLSDEEKQWLSNFNEEYLSGNFDHEGKKFHKSKKARRECYARNNSRNRDLYALARTHGWTVPTDENEDNAIDLGRGVDIRRQENAVVALIDSVNEPRDEEPRKAPRRSKRAGPKKR